MNCYKGETWTARPHEWGFGLFDSLGQWVKTFETKEELGERAKELGVELEWK